jgi:flavin reductase (DIM6/NTAB) family NADH-FMN oxidoreductase RutF
MKRSLGAKSLVYPTPVFVIGSYDEKGEPNLMTCAWAGICCSKPPAIGVSLRKATYTYGNIISRKAFTVNVPTEEMVVQADYLGMVSGRTEDKFAAVGFTPVRSDIVDAPYIEECAMVLECRLMQTVEIGLHTQFIGEIVDTKIDEEMLADDGLPDIGNARSERGLPDNQGQAVHLCAGRPKLLPHRRDTRQGLRIWQSDQAEEAQGLIEIRKSTIISQAAGPGGRLLSRMRYVPAGAWYGRC